jgi:pSer/pThr/pTyr-binding forkhead associated (FHA) protein
MLIAERPASERAQSSMSAPPAVPGVAAGDVELVLQPLVHPELGEIRVNDTVFAVGRTEPPFADYPPDLQVMLSRRHARLFRENGAFYLADLDSRNGTTVNRAALANVPRRLNDGDEIGFGGVLSYRVQMTPRASAPRPPAVTVTLTPESGGDGLEPIVIARFPFLVSKTDAAFARFRHAQSRQADYLSRRHAHIFQKGDTVCIEDLGSTNGTFVDGARLDEHAVPLHDGAVLTLGGEEFAYRVSVVRGPDAPVAAPLGTTEAPPVQAGKTTFVAAPDSFLDIFCVEAPSEAGTEAAAAAPAALPVPSRGKPRGRVTAFVAELAKVLVGGERDRMRRSLWRGVALLGVLCAVIVALALWSPLDRRLKEMIDAGEFAQASKLADEALADRPDDAALRALGTEAALKAHVPAWLDRLAARDFAGASAALATLSELGGRNPDLQPLASELAWLDQLERLVERRGGPDAPIRIFADEGEIAAVLERWNTNTSEHQRALARIASYVPQFGAPYGEALTHLRKLQSDATVLLAAIDRLKATVAAELSRDRPDAIEPVLKEYADRYPGLGGLEALQQDLARYLDIVNARAGHGGRLFAALLKARFVTPPFQRGFESWRASGQLPAPALMRQYEASTQSWKDGRAAESLAQLQRIAAGPWAGALGIELERRRAVLAQFAALNAARSTPTAVEQLLAFRAALDADEDQFYLRATEADLMAQKDRVVAHAQQFMNKARALWQEYRGAGAIEASQRIEITVSSAFRTRARLLAEASRAARQGLQISAQVGAGGTEGWATVAREIAAEMQLQRNALLDLRNVLEPELMRTKLALLDEASE